MPPLIALLHCLREICLFRAGPQDLPYSTALATRLSVALVGLGVMGMVLQGSDPGRMPLRVGMIVLFLLLPAWLLLRWRGFASRYVQTLTAIAGVGVLYNLLALPLVVSLAARQDAIGTDPGLAVISWMLLALTLWRLLVSAHIWRHALSLPLSAGAIIALGLFIAQVVLARWLYLAGA